MHWQESDDNFYTTVRSDVVDMVFRMRCEQLPLDHAQSLLLALELALPWFCEAPSCGIHPIHGAESSHGWHRPTEGDTHLVRLSRRVRLTLRVPRQRVEQCGELRGRKFTVDGQKIELGSFTLRDISPSQTLFSRRIAFIDGANETAVLEQVQQELSCLEVNVPKILPGRPDNLSTAEGSMVVRSLLLADVPLEDSVTIQETGLGTRQGLGCGLFVPYKSIATLDKA